MGNVLFEENQFVLSGAYLDSTLQVLSPKTRTYRKIKRKRDKLNDIIDYETTRKTTDSLLVLIDKTPEEQNAIFESLSKPQNSRFPSTCPTRTTTAIGCQQLIFLTVIFISTTVRCVTRGESEFYRIWGNIKKTDNWRYSSLQSVAFTA